MSVYVRACVCASESMTMLVYGLCLPLTSIKEPSFVLTHAVPLYGNVCVG